MQTCKMFIALASGRVQSCGNWLNDFSLQEKRQAALKAVADAQREWAEVQKEVDDLEEGLVELQEDERQLKDFLKVEKKLIGLQVRFKHLRPFFQLFLFSNVVPIVELNFCSEFF